MKKTMLQKLKIEDIICPHCHKKGTWTKDNPSRPFCSPRCKLIDLGAWASEQHRIAGEPATLHEDAESKSDDTE
jgi:endogenous inhibitor of DNA gyrase (YacG/DUF329 family)